MIRILVLTCITCAIAVAASNAYAVTPIDKCSNLKGIQKKIPAGYKRGAKFKCVRKTADLPSCTGNQVLEPDGKCHTIPTTPPPPPTPIVWWTADYTAWDGPGNNVVATSDHTPLVAYKPSTCRTAGGSEVPNGTIDPFGRVCWSYLFQVNVIWSNGGKAGCGSFFVRLRETAGGVIVGDTIGAANDIPNNTPVQIRSSVSSDGHPDMKIEISSIDCYAP